MEVIEPVNASLTAEYVANLTRELLELRNDSEAVLEFREVLYSTSFDVSTNSTDDDLTALARELEEGTRSTLDYTDTVQITFGDSIWVDGEWVEAWEVSRRRLESLFYFAYVNLQSNFFHIVSNVAQQTQRSTFPTEFNSKTDVDVTDTSVDENVYGRVDYLVAYGDMSGWEEAVRKLDPTYEVIFY